MIFWNIQVNTREQTHINKPPFFWKLALNTLSHKKMADSIKTQSTGEKQQLTWTNVVDNSISSYENLKALIDYHSSLVTQSC